MIETDINEDPNENRMLAEYLIETYTFAMRHIMETSTTVSRWVVTSLLAINGAAAVAILDQQMAPGGKLTSCLLFSAGVLAALSAAHFTTKAIRKVLAPMGEALGYWVSVKHDGQRVLSLEGHEDKLANVNREAGRIPSLLGYASAGLFTAGLICSAVFMAAAPAVPT